MCKEDMQWLVLSTQGPGSQLELLRSAQPGGRLHSQGVSFDSVERVISGDYFETTMWLWDHHFLCALLAFTVTRTSKSSACLAKALHAVSQVLGEKLKWMVIQGDAEAAFWNAIHDVLQSEQSGDQKFYRWNNVDRCLVDPDTGTSREAGCKWHLVHNFAHHAKTLTVRNRERLTKLGHRFCDAPTEEAFQQVCGVSHCRHVSKCT